MCQKLCNNDSIHAPEAARPTPRAASFSRHARRSSGARGLLDARVSGGPADGAGPPEDAGAPNRRYLLKGGAVLSMADVDLRQLRSALEASRDYLLEAAGVERVPF